MKNIQSQHWSLKRKIMFPKNKNKNKRKKTHNKQKKNRKNKEQK